MIPEGMACLILKTVSMESGQPEFLHYKRSHFVTRLPLSYRYSPAHAWVQSQPNGICRVGLTKFATRMLGDIVDHGFDTKVGSTIRPGDVLGWIEGFKAISDVFCIGQGKFVGSNAELKADVTLISEDPYGRGWLYEFEGEPDAGCVDVEAYRAILDATIDRMLEKQKGQEIA